MVRPETLTNHSIKSRGKKRQVQIRGIGSSSRGKVTVMKMLLVIHFSYHFAASKPVPSEGLDGLVSLRGYRNPHKNLDMISAFSSLSIFKVAFGTHPMVYPKQGRFLPRGIIQCQKVKYQFYLNTCTHTHTFVFFKLKNIFTFFSTLIISSCYHLYLLSK